MYEADVADIASLKALVVTGLPDHTRVRVRTLLQEFWLDKRSTAAFDGITVVNARLPGPTGRWLRNPLPVPEWTEKKEWYQNTIRGDDENSGDALTGVRTMAEITRRLRRVDSALYTIHQQEAVAVTDSVRFTPEISDKGAEFFPDTQTVAKILIQGKRRTVPPTIPPAPPMVFAATSETDPKTNTQATVTDASADWSKQLRQILEVTTGKAIGAQAVVLKDFTGGKARVSDWALPATGALSAAIPVALDQYQILSLPEFSAPISYAGLPSSIELGFQEVTFTKPSAPFPEGVLPAAYTTTFTSCRFEVPLPGPPAAFPFVCVLRACSVFFKTPTNFSQTSVGNGPRINGCGFINARIQVNAYGRTSITDSVIQGGAIRQIDKSRIFGGLIAVAGKLGILDSPPGESAITLRRGMAMQIVAAASLYGSENGLFGVEVMEGATLAIQTGVTPSITGKTADLQIEGLSTAIPPLAPGKAIKAEPLSTWAEWTDPKKPFVRNVFNYKTGSRIISTL